jgi:hypothetical protein
MVGLIVVMAVVLLLVAKAWQRFGADAIAVTAPGAARPVDDHGETGAGAALRSGDLPRLQEAQERTDAHAERVQEALESAE